MNAVAKPSSPRKPFNWRDDLNASRGLTRNEVQAFGFVVGWFEDWRIRMELPPGVESAREFWRVAVKSKPRQDWQLSQWAEGMRWYLRWFEICSRDGGDGRSIPERLRAVVHSVGARRGLELATRKTYAGWLVRFGAWAGTERRVMDQGVAREWLADLVNTGKRAFSTQKQALNALAFFYRDVCGHEQVELQVKMRKIKPRAAVILDINQVLAVIGKLEPRYQVMASLQYGAGLRLSELTRLRIKDVDLNRGVLTIRSGKGDRDRLTVIPNCLKPVLELQIARSRTLWEQDRANQVPGVSLLGMELKFPKSGVKWAWHWLFPAPTLSVDPESGIERRHHIHPKVYGTAFRRAAEAVVDNMRVTTPSFCASLRLCASPSFLRSRGFSRKAAEAHRFHKPGGGWSKPSERMVEARRQARQECHHGAHPPIPGLGRGDGMLRRLAPPRHRLPVQGPGPGAVR